MRMPYILTAALVSSLAVAASLPPMMPVLGQWQITTSIPAEQKAAMQGMDAKAMKAMEQHGMSYDLKAGTMTMKICLNKQTINDWSLAGDRASRKGSCEKPSYSVSGSTLTMDLKCGAPRTMTMHSVYQFSPARDSYTFQHHMESEGRTMDMNGRAQRVGDC